MSKKEPNFSVEFIPGDDVTPALNVFKSWMEILMDDVIKGK